MGSLLYIRRRQNFQSHISGHRIPNVERLTDRITYLTCAVSRMVRHNIQTQTRVRCNSSSHFNLHCVGLVQRANRQNKHSKCKINPLKPELNPICSLLALLGAHNFLHVSRIRVKLLTFRLLMSYIYGAPILDVSRSHATTQHSR